MKRIFAFILSFLVFLFAASAIAEEMDISSLTLDELIELQGKITSRINEALSASSDVIYMGEYVGGVDIKPGRYLVTGLEEKFQFGMCLYADTSAMDSDDYLINKGLFGGETYDLEIEEGMVLEVYRGSAIVTSHAKPSWAP